MNRLLVVLGLVALSAPAHAQTALSCATLPSLADKFLDSHVERTKLDPELAGRVVERYLSFIDPQKSLLLQSDEEVVRKRVRAVVDALHKGRCEDLFALHSERVKWHKAAEDYVRAEVKKAEPIDRTVAFKVDPDERQRPATGAERDALRRKLVHFQLANYVAAGTKLEEARGKLVHRYELITKRVKEMDRADVTSEFLDAFATALDPHSTYFSADDLEDFNISMRLSLEGIGAVLQSRDGYTIVREIVPGGAAAREGSLKTKDKIIAVAQGEEGEPQDVVDVALRDVVRLIRGKKGTQVRLTVLRQGERTQTLNILITRDKISLEERAARLRWQEVKRGERTLKLAILELPSFYGGRGSPRQCTDDVRRLLAEAKVGGADGLLLDLSRNSGGLLSAAVEIGGFFIREGNVVGVDGRTSRMQEMADDDDDVHYAGPMVVLTSLVSASASEIVTGALKDYDRAVIVGDKRTFGKGTVQVVQNLPIGLGAIKVTTALFFRPGGKSTQSEGVASDIVLPSLFADDKFGESQQTYSLPSRTIPAFLSPDANASSGEQRWTPVDQATVTRLAAASAKRVAANAKFKEINEKRAKAEERDGMLRVAEILDEKGAGEEEDEEEEAKSDELSPQALEAVEILADLAAK